MKTMQVVSSPLNGGVVVTLQREEKEFAARITPIVQILGRDLEVRKQCSMPEPICYGLAQESELKLLCDRITGRIYLAHHPEETLIVEFWEVCLRTGALVPLGEFDLFEVEGCPSVADECPMDFRVDNGTFLVLVGANNAGCCADYALCGAELHSGADWSVIVHCPRLSGELEKHSFFQCRSELFVGWGNLILRLDLAVRQVVALPIDFDWRSEAPVNAIGEIRSEDSRGMWAMRGEFDLVYCPKGWSADPTNWRLVNLPLRSGVRWARPLSKLGYDWLVSDAAVYFETGELYLYSGGTKWFRVGKFANLVDVMDLEPKDEESPWELVLLQRDGEGEMNLVRHVMSSTTT